MTQTATAMLVLGLALLAANLPFVSRRFLAIVPVRSKSVGVRFLEMVILYCMWGAIGLALEGHRGQIAPQQWQFYAITVVLFLTLAFPGFVFCYLLRRDR